MVLFTWRRKELGCYHLKSTCIRRMLMHAHTHFTQKLLQGHASHKPLHTNTCWHTRKLSHLDTQIGGRGRGGRQLGETEMERVRETITEGEREREMGGTRCQEINLSSCQASQIINHTNVNGDTHTVYTQTITHTLTLHQVYCSAGQI